MNCTIKPTFRLAPEDAAAILKDLSKVGSAFQCKLANLAEIDGSIAIVMQGTDMVAWARTEHWRDMGGRDWETLEAFTLPSHRRRGLARFAAAGLSASGSIKVQTVAVFASPMLSVAKAAGLMPTLFRLDENGRWATA